MAMLQQGLLHCNTEFRAVAQWDPSPFGVTGLELKFGFIKQLQSSEICHRYGMVTSKFLNCGAEAEEVFYQGKKLWITDYYKAIK